MPIPPTFPFVLDLKEGFVQVDSCQNGRIYYNEKTGICKKFSWTTGEKPRHTIEYFDSLSMERLHRVDGPALIKLVAATGFPTDLYWYVHGVAHRDENEGPQCISYGFDIVVNEVYRKNGLVHRDADKPACILYKLNDQERSFDDIEYQKQIVENEYWYKNDHIHRDGGPAIIKYRKTLNGDSEVVCEYYKQGIRHRLDGPAQYLRRARSGSCDVDLWFVNGIGVDVNRYPVIRDGRIVNRIKLDKAALIDAAMFDREYGKFLLDFSRRYDLSACYIVP